MKNIYRHWSISIFSVTSRCLSLIALPKCPLLVRDIIGYRLWERIVMELYSVLIMILSVLLPFHDLQGIIKYTRMYCRIHVSSLLNLWWGSRSSVVTVLYAITPLHTLGENTSESRNTCDVFSPFFRPLKEARWPHWPGLVQHLSLPLRCTTATNHGCLFRPAPSTSLFHILQLP